MRDHYEIWQRVLGYRPIEGQRYTNPFRTDRSPNVTFEWVGKYLRMKDWGNSYYHNINCFDGVAIRILGHKIGEFGDVDTDMASVREFISGVSKFEYTPELVKRFTFDLQAHKRDLTGEELAFYETFGISQNNLADDDVTGCDWYKYNSSKDPRQYYIRYPQDLAFIQWRGEHKKIYRPKQKEYKFTTDTTGDDYWAFGSGGLGLIFEGHKDARVAYNMGFNSIGLQSSTILPSEFGVELLKKRYERIIYIGDWDFAGISNGERISKTMGIEHRYFNSVVRTRIHSKDLADLYVEVGRNRAIKALNYLAHENR